ncbi:imidazole glycerol phosphate synthase subunit HisH [Candidatus Pelagibacter sp.]|nr:imidazole glycerol phosphate synthase subunit HisH [Candidatus Pelagibacter sp.]
MNKKIVIIKLNIGNYNSISKCLKKLNIKHIVSDNNEDIASADKIILPGIGSFGPFLKEIFDKKIDQIILSKFSKKKPILGICVGYQSFFEHSDESSNVKGLSLLNGKFKKLNFNEQKKKNIAQKNHLGWNDVAQIKKNVIFEGITDKSDFFFNHGYMLTSYQNDYIYGTTKFNSNFPSVVNKDKLYGVQFHPEKSQKNGLLILKNFCEKC